VRDVPPLVSVLMPAFNAEQYVRRAVQSVVDQTFDGWELILADDGSTDATAAAAGADRDPRIRILSGEHTGLPAAARNRALTAARGRFIAFLDADDEWRPDKLRIQMEVLAGEPVAGLVHTNAEVLRDGAVVSRAATGDVSLWPDFQRLLEGNCLINSSVLLRRELLERHGAFDVDPVLRGTEDYELWLRLAPLTRYAFLDEPLVLYREHTGGISRRTREMELGVLAAQERNLRRYPNERAKVDPKVLGVIGALRCLYGLPGRGRPELLASLRRAPWRLRWWKWLALSLLDARAIEHIQHRFARG
jgi:glycosyltransferase involved in cell wall biosynthesis